MRVKLLDGVVFDVDLQVTDETMVDELKRLIAEHSSGAPIDRQRVIFRGKVLKEGHALREYGVTSDSTVHLVTRPDNATNPPQTEPASGPEPAAPPGLGAGGVFMSTVNIGEGDTLPDFNDIVNRMLTSIPGALGAAAASTIPSAAPPQTIATLSAVDSIRQQLNHVARALSANEAVNDLTLSNDVPSVAQTTAQLRDLSSALILLLNQVQGVLQRPSLATDPESRASTERICSQLGQALGMLGPAVQQLGGILAQTRLGAAPGQEYVQLPSAGVTVAIHVPEADGSAPSDAPVLQPVNGQQDMTHAFTLNGPITLRARRTAARSSSNERSSSNNRPIAVLPRLNNNINSNSNDFSRSQNQNRPDLSAMLSSVASMLGGQISSGQPQGGPAQPQPTFRPSFNQAQTSQPPNQQSSTTTQRPESTQPDARQPPSALAGADFFQMIGPMMSSMMGGDGSAPSSLADLASLVPQGDSTDEPSNPFDAFLQRVMSRLQLSDLMAIFGGDWSCLEPLQQEMRTALIENFMHGSDTPETRQHVVDSITDYLLSHLNNDEAIAPVRSRLRSGTNVAAESRAILLPHVERIVSLILSGSSPFSSEFKRLLTLAIGHWVESASSWFDDGSISVETLLKGLVRSRMESLGPELAMLGSFSSGIVTSILMNCRSQYVEAAALESNASGQEQWMLELPPNVAMEWRLIIDADMLQQSNMPPQRPLSDSYSFGRDNV